jgi:hypothetical protein
MYNKIYLQLFFELILLKDRRKIKFYVKSRLSHVHFL